MPPVQMDVIALLPEGWGICLSCEMLLARANLDQSPAERGLDEYPPDWQEDFRRLAALVFDLAARYGDSLQIRLWDPRSLQGLLKSLRYGVRRYPTFVVAGREKVVGWNQAGLEQSLQAAGATLVV
ncbi:MAG: hypothetical protein FJZ89_10090 [Chloroflexi bacterium]|nr:hypothetical protein [Chloroflexota bacterium]